MPGMSSTNTAVAAAQRILEAVQQETELVQAIQNRDPRTFRLSAFNRQNIMRTHLSYQKWKHIGRQVLAMHPEVVDEVKVASSDKIPGEVLRTLPYMNPLVVFAEPPVFKSWLQPGATHKGNDRPDESMRLLGFFTFGTSTVGVDEPSLVKDQVRPSTRRVEQRIYATNDSEADRFGMLLVFEALDAMGRVIDLEFNTITVFFHHTLTLKETIDGLMARYHWDGDAGDKQARKWMREVLGTALGSLFYLCSTTLEAEKVPAKATKHLGRGITRKPLSLYRVGWTTGAALTRYRQARANSTSEQADMAHQMQDPQHRRSHFKMQPCGKNKTDRKLIFVSAYWTHRERLGEEGVNTARSVPRVNGKGSAKESARTAITMVNVPKMEVSK